MGFSGIWLLALFGDGGLFELMGWVFVPGGCFVSAFGGWLFLGMLGE